MYQELLESLLGDRLHVEPAIGLGGREFGVYKIRTMPIGSGSLDEELIHRNGLDGSGHIVNNTRPSTRFDRFLRATHIDELPQFFNILEGDMGLIGPRPHNQALFSALPQDVQKSYLQHQPGLCGVQYASLRSRRESDYVNALRKYFERFEKHPRTTYLQYGARILALYPLRMALGAARFLKDVLPGMNDRKTPRNAESI